MQNDQLWLLDVIESVGTHSCTDLACNDAQRSFDDMVQPRTEVNLCLNRLESLPPPAKFISQGMGTHCSTIVASCTKIVTSTVKGTAASHILVMKCFGNDSLFGLTMKLTSKAVSVWP